jgi:transcriptional regulator with XRE-family HTH domain
MKKHWTQRSIKDYLFRITSDFFSQVEDKMETEGISQDKLAKKLKVTKSAVSQKLNKPGNISLETIIKYASVVGLKVSIVAYDDKDDPNNEKGPINSEIFKIVWEKANKPRDFWAVADMDEEKNVASTIFQASKVDLPRTITLTDAANAGLRFAQKAVTDKTQSILACYVRGNY